MELETLPLPAPPQVALTWHPVELELPYAVGSSSADKRPMWLQLSSKAVGDAEAVDLATIQGYYYQGRFWDAATDRNVTCLVVAWADRV